MPALTRALACSAEENGHYATAHTFSVHTQEVVGCALNPTGEFLLTASADMSLALHDVHMGITRAHITDSDSRKQPTFRWGRFGGMFQDVSRDLMCLVDCHQ